MKKMMTAWFFMMSIVTSLAIAPNQLMQPEAPSVNSEQALIDILENDTLRNRLIQALKSSHKLSGDADHVAQPVVHLVAEFHLSLAGLMHFVSDNVMASFSAIKLLMNHFLSNFRELVSKYSFSELFLALSSFFFVVFTALFIRWGLARIAKDTLNYLCRKRQEGVWSTTSTVIARSLIDISNSLLAWFVSYLFVMLVIEQVWLKQAIHHLLIAYLVFSIVLVVLRIILSPFYEPLRLIDLSNAASKTCYDVLRWLSAYILFVILFVTGIMVSSGADTLLISAYEELVVCVLALILLVLILRYRLPIALWIKPKENNDDLQKMSGVYALRLKLSKVWHWVAVVYLLVMLWAWLFDFEQTFSHQVESSFLTILLVIGFLGVRWIIETVEHSIESTIVLKQKKLPFFTKRALALVHSFRFVLQLIVVVVTWCAFLSIWRLIDLDLLYVSSFWQNVILPFLDVLITVSFALLIWLGLLTLIELKLIDSQKVHPRFAKDNDTLLHLLRNVITIATVLITGIIVLADLGVHVGPLIAGAGILSLAIGFGAQTLVKDVINGLFNIIEGTLKVGSWVKINGQEGWVEKVTLRTVSLRNNQTGTLSIVPFSSVSIVENFTKGYAFYYTSIEVGYDEDYDRVAEVLSQVGDALVEHSAVKNEILAPLEIRGLTAFEANGYKVSCRIKTMAGRQRVVGRIFNRLVKEMFDREGIKFPYPTRTIHLIKDDDIT